MMAEHLLRLMHANDAPVEQYERLGLDVEYQALLQSGKLGGGHQDGQ